VHLLFLTLAIYMFYRRAQQLPIFPKFLSSIFSGSWLKVRAKQ